MFLPTRGGGDGTGVGGSTADGRDLPGFFIFAADSIHVDDVRPECIPVCRRQDPNNAGASLPARFYCNKKGGVTGDVGVKYVTGCIAPCLPDLSADAPAVLILDGHGSHNRVLDLPIGIIVVLRPPHTTHVLQGEDVTHLRFFKSAYHQAKMLRLSDNVLRGSCRLTSADLIAAAKVPWQEAFSRKDA